MLLIVNKPPELSEVRPAAVAPPAVVTNTDKLLSSAPATPPLMVTALDANKPVSRKTCSPAVTVTVESLPAQVTPFAPIVPPATTAPKISTSFAPLRLILLRACFVVTLEVPWT